MAQLNNFRRLDLRSISSHQKSQWEKLHIPRVTAFIAEKLDSMLEVPTVYDNARYSFFRNRFPNFRLSYKLRSRTGRTSSSAEKVGHHFVVIMKPDKTHWPCKPAAVLSCDRRARSIQGPRSVLRAWIPSRICSRTKTDYGYELLHPASRKAPGRRRRHSHRHSRGCFRRVQGTEWIYGKKG